MKKLENGVLKMGKICYNTNCAACSTWDRLNGKCIYSDGCSEFKENGFGSAKKKTNFDHIREDITAEKFAEMFCRTGCPGNMDAEDCAFVGNCKDCWLNWLNSEYHN